MSTTTSPRLALAWPLVFVLLSAPAFGGQYAGPMPPLDRAARVDLAHRLSAGFAPLLSSLPTLSPSQAEWLKSEAAAAEAGRSAERMTNLFYSVEQNIDQARSHLRVMVHALDKLADPDVNPDDEVLHWTIVARSLALPELWQSLYLLIGENALDPQRLDFVNKTPTNERLTTTRATSQGVEILDRIVVPYLDGRLP